MFLVLTLERIFVLHRIIGDKPNSGIKSTKKFNETTHSNIFKASKDKNTVTKLEFSEYIVKYFHPENKWNYHLKEKSMQRS